MKLSEEEHPHLFHAALVSVGRLGIILDVTLRIDPQPVLARTRENLSPEEGVARMMAIQTKYAEAKKKGDASHINRVLKDIGDILVRATPAFRSPAPGRVLTT